MKSPLLTLLLLLATLMLMAQEPYPDGFLPKKLTEEEKLRLHEIDRNREPSNPPPQPPRNIAEFEPMSGALVRFPLGIPVSLVALISEEVEVVSIVADEQIMNQAINTYQNNGVNMDNCSFLIAPTNSIYTRDYGPWFIFSGDNEIGIVDFEYDRPRPFDNAIPGMFAAENNISYYHMGLLHTGGDYMTDGMGTSASTAAAYSVNSGFTPAQVDSILALYLGIENYHVVPNVHGGLSHIDTWAKFLAPDKIMIREVAPDHPYHMNAEQAVAYFESQISSYGTPYRVYRVFTPNNEPYTNTLILNNRVFVPLNGSAWDAAAVAAFEEAMPGYSVYGIPFGGWNSNDALHCRVKEVADRHMLHIYHQPISADQQHHIDYEIRARIIPMSGEALVIGSPKVYYRVDTGEFQYVIMEYDEDYWYTAYILQQTIDSKIDYYIQAADGSGRSENHPYIGAFDPHTFNVTGPLVFTEAYVDDATYGNNNGIFEPGETVSIVATYRNDGPETIHALSAMLFTNSQFLSIHPPAAALQDSIVPGGPVSFMFTVSSSLTTPLNYTAAFNLEVESGDGFGSSDSFNIDLTAYVVTEYLLVENFDNWPIEGWEVTSTSGQINWRQNNSDLAGGLAPEAQFHYNPSTIAIQRLITPALNTSGLTHIKLDFKHLINHYADEYQLRVETSGDGGQSWKSIVAYPNADRPAIAEEIIIENEDVGSENFRIAWTFDGDSWNINWWNIDDVAVGGITINDNIGFFEGQVALLSGPGILTDVLISAGGQFTFPDAEGFFSLAVHEGIHDITASLPGYVPKTYHGILIAEGETISLEFGLEYIAAPENLSCEAGINTVLLMWDAPQRYTAMGAENSRVSSPGETHETFTSGRPVSLYHVYRSLDYSAFALAGLAVQPGFTDQVTDEGFYQYQVTAVYDGEYESGPSNSVGTTMYNVFFEVDGDNGELTAAVGEIEIITGDLAGEGTSIGFTALPQQGFRVKEWKLNDEVQAGQTDTIFTIESLASTVVVAVAFDAIMHIVNFGVVGGNGIMTASAEGIAINPGDEVAEGSSVLFTALADDGFIIHEWIINGSVLEGYIAPEFLIACLDGAVEAEVSFEKITGLTGLFGNAVTVVPNPSRGKFYVTAGERIKHIRMLSLDGRLVLNTSVEAYHTQLDASHLAPGHYIMQVQTANALFTIRVVVLLR